MVAAQYVSGERLAEMAVMAATHQETGPETAAKAAMRYTHTLKPQTLIHSIMDTEATVVAAAAVVDRQDGVIMRAKVKVELEAMVVPEETEEMDALSYITKAVKKC